MKKLLSASFGAMAAFAGLVALPSPALAQQVPAGLFRVGIGGYYTNGQTACYFGSIQQVNDCGFTSASYFASPIYSSVPIGLTMTGHCGCSASQPLQLYPGAVTVSPPSSEIIIYDSTLDATTTGCVPLVDSPAYPIAYPVPGGSEFRFATNGLDPQGRQGNFWIRNTLASDGSGFKEPRFRADCRPMLSAELNPDERAFRGAEWIAGFYPTAQGLFALIHNEYYGGDFPSGFDFRVPQTSRCPSGNPVDCWYGALGVAKWSVENNRFERSGPGPDGHVIARPRAPYDPKLGRAAGYTINTNIVNGNDGYYYNMVTDANYGTCIERTPDLGNPSAWRALTSATWDWSAQPARGDACAPLYFYDLAPMYFGYSTYYSKLIVVGLSRGNMFGFSLSSDVGNWSVPVSLGIQFGLNPDGWSYNYPALIDLPQVAQAWDGNYQTGVVVGRTPYVSFVRMKRNPPGVKPELVSQIVLRPITFQK